VNHFQRTDFSPESETSQHPNSEPQPQKPPELAPLIKLGQTGTGLEAIPAEWQEARRWLPWAWFKTENRLPLVRRLMHWRTGGFVRTSNTAAFTDLTRALRARRYWKSSGVAYAAPSGAVRFFTVIPAAPGPNRVPVRIGRKQRAEQ
jgi:hypothetical protein